MRLPRECYQMEEQLAQYLPVLRPAQRRGLALWVYGAVVAQSACQNAVVSALGAVGRFHTVRQYLREWLYDGADKAAPCQPQVEVEHCFAPLLGWLLAWWQGRELALAVDATLHGQRVAALVVSVLYRGSAVPVAWHILPANRKGAWLRPLGRLLRQLRPAIPKEMQVVVFADRGLWSPRLVADDSGRGLASDDASASGDRLSTVRGRAPASRDLGPGSRGGLGRARGALSGAPAPAGGHARSGLGRGATGTVGGGDRSRPGPSRAVLVRLTDVD